MHQYYSLINIYKDHPYFQKMIRDGLTEFINIHVKCFDNHLDVPIHFVGSIAHYCEDILRKVAKENKLKLGKIDKKPIEGLINYHLKYKLELA